MTRMRKLAVRLAAVSWLLFVTHAAAVAQPQGRWVAAWASAMAPADASSAIPDAELRGATVRQTVRVSVGGRRIRLRLSNDHGPAPLTLASVRVVRSATDPDGALPANAAQRLVTFAGRPSATIPANAYLLSDPIALPVGGGEALIVSIAFDAPPARQTLHHLALTTGHVAPGDQAASPTLTGARTTDHWHQLAAVEVKRDPAQAGEAIAVLGDSITDGHGATRDGDDRWTDVLAARLRQDPAFDGVSVLNLGIAGNRLMRDGGAPSGLARLDRDVFSQSGLTTLIVLIGVNDLGLISREGPVTPQARAAAVDGVIAGYGQIIARAHARGVRVIGATLPPFGGTPVYRSDAAADADRRQVNTWIRATGRFDAVIDFDAVLRDPAAPQRLLPAYDTGDHLHPSTAGYRAMGEAVPLSILTSRR